MNLALQTTFQRGFNAALSAYPVMVVSAVQVGVPGNLTIKALVNFNTPVPNGDGRLVLTLVDGRKVTLSVRYIPEGDPDNSKKVPMGQPITNLWAIWDPNAKKFNPANLQYARGQLYSDDYPPGFSTIDTMAKRANNNLESIRANTSIVNAQGSRSP